MSVRYWAVAVVLWLCANGNAGAQDASATQPAAGSSAAKAGSGWKVEIAPVYVWAPINLNTVSLPSFPDLPPPPGGGDFPKGDTGASLTGAYMGAFRLEKSRWELGGSVVWAGLSGEKDAPFAKVSGNVIYGELLTGVRTVGGLFVEGGVRRVAIDVRAQVLDYPEVSRKPGVWDPVVGATYRLPMGSHWLLAVHGDVGGFGAGSDLDANARAILDWTPARHFGLTLGYQMLYIRIDDTVLDSTRLERTLKLWANFNGPIVGFKLLF